MHRQKRRLKGKLIIYNIKCLSIAKQRVAKHILAETNTKATMKEPRRETF
jgi:hypothetical protein